MFNNPDSLKASCDKFADRLIVSNVDQSCTFAQFYQDVIECMGLLQGQGVKSGDIVCISGANTYSFLVIDIAISCADAVSLVLPESFLDDTPLDLAKRFSFNYFILINEESFRQSEVQRCRQGNALDSGLSDTLTLVISSGTSGSYKGMAVTNAGNAALANDFANVFQMGEYQSILIFLPLTAFQQRLFAYIALHHGLDIHITNFKNVFRSILKHGAGIMIAPPAFYNALIDAELLPHLKKALLISGMAPLSSAVIEAYDEADLTIYQVYGLTETGLLTANHQGDNTYGTVGKPMPNTDIRIASNGEIIARKHPNLCSGYFYAEESVDIVGEFDDWFSTGDVGHIDGKGHLVVEGRVGSTITMPNGHKVQPEIIETQIEKGANIRHCVVSLNADKNGLCVIVPQQEQRIKMTQINGVISAVNAQLPSHCKITATKFADQEFDVDNGYLNRSLKINRKKIVRDFSEA